MGTVLVLRNHTRVSTLVYRLASPQTSISGGGAWPLTPCAEEGYRQPNQHVILGNMVVEGA